MTGQRDGFAGEYILSGSMLANIIGPILDLRGRQRVSFTAAWSAVAATDGDWNFECTDDPRALRDLREATTTANWTTRTIPNGSSDGLNITVTGKNITVNASAGEFNLVLANPPAFGRLTYTRRAGGAAGQVRIDWSLA